MTQSILRKPTNDYARTMAVQQRAEKPTAAELAAIRGSSTGTPAGSAGPGQQSRFSTVDMS